MAKETMFLLKIAVAIVALFLLPSAANADYHIARGLAAPTHEDSYSDRERRETRARNEWIDRERARRDAEIEREDRERLFRSVQPPSSGGPREDLGESLDRRLRELRRRYDSGTRY